MRLKAAARTTFRPFPRASRPSERLTGRALRFHDRETRSQSVCNWGVIGVRSGPNWGAIALQFGSGHVGIRPDTVASSALQILGVSLCGGCVLGDLACPDPLGGWV